MAVAYTEYGPSLKPAKLLTLRSTYPRRGLADQKVAKAGNKAAVVVEGDQAAAATQQLSVGVGEAGGAKDDVGSLRQFQLEVVLVVFSGSIMPLADPPSFNSVALDLGWCP